MKRPRTSDDVGVGGAGAGAGAGSGSELTVDCPPVSGFGAGSGSGTCPTPVSLIQCQPDACTSPRPLPSSRVSFEVQSLAREQLKWSSPPANFLIVKKWKQPAITESAFDLALWMVEERKDLIVWVMAEEPLPVHTRIKPYTTECQDIVDVVVALGGDGTVLHLASLFSGSLPPVMAVSWGSLGFLTAFDPDGIKEAVRKVWDGDKTPVDITNRCRIHVTIQRADAEVPDIHMLGLNELCVERGSSPFMTKLKATVDDVPLTTVQADGILVATPTGSTAYSVSAGGPIVFPTVSGLLFTPICPHSLSFRPLMLPDSCKVTLSVPHSARASVRANVDGRSSHELFAGDSVTVYVSPHPLPLITVKSATQDFFDALRSKLHWNAREEQLPFDGDAAAKKKASADTPSSRM